VTEPLDRVLRLVAEGHLSADDAAPILDALQQTRANAATATDPAAGRAGARGGAAPEDARSLNSPAGSARGPRVARIEVREAGRRVVDLRIPISLGRFALARVPGLSAEQIAEVEEAVSTGAHGTILDVEDPDGDSVRIILE